MSEKESDTKSQSRYDSTSRFGKTILVVLAAIFAFSGPYLVLVLSRVLDLDYAISTVSGVAIFVVGLVLIWYLVRKRVVF